MGASDSKLVFKQGILRLSEPASIPADQQWSGVSGLDGSEGRLLGSTGAVLGSA